MLRDNFCLYTCYVLYIVQCTCSTVDNNTAEYIIMAWFWLVAGLWCLLLRHSTCVQYSTVQYSTVHCTNHPMLATSQPVKVPTSTSPAPVCSPVTWTTTLQWIVSLCVFSLAVRRGVVVMPVYLSDNMYWIIEYQSYLRNHTVIVSTKFLPSSQLTMLSCERVKCVIENWWVSSSREVQSWAVLCDREETIVIESETVIL